MRDYLVERVKNVAHYILATRETIRETAKHFGYSKSTIHKDLNSRLKQIDMNLYKSTQEILDEHFALKHIRGGESTKRKYLEVEAQ